MIGSCVGGEQEENRSSSAFHQSVSRPLLTQKADFPVVPGNPDLVDTLGVEAQPFRYPSFYLNGHSGSSAGLRSHSGRSSD
jgi:hypothetical protein